MKQFVLLCSLVLGLVACNNPELVELPAEVQKGLLLNLATYLDDRPENVSGDARFDSLHRAHYERVVELNEAELVSLVQKRDTLYFLYKKRDRRSLYEHYRFIGGKMVSRSLPEIDYLDILFHTPRLAPDDLDKGSWLFEQVLKGKSLEAYWGDMKYLEWPDKDYGYNPQTRKWELRKESKLNEVEYFREKKAD
jgi:hypothetical protein